MKHFPDTDLTFKLGSELDCYDFDLIDSVQDIFQKYYKIDQHRISKQEQARVMNLIDPNVNVRPMSCVIEVIK